jgi:hypothetical protein
MNVEDVYSRIQGEKLDELVGHTLDFLLTQPIAVLVDQTFVQKQIIGTLQTLSHGEQTEKWAKEILDQLRVLAPEETPTVDRELLEPIEEFLSFPFALDEQICLSLMQHDAIEELMRAVLTDTIEEFGAKIKTITQGAAPANVSKGFGAFRSLRDKALKSTPLGGITQIIEKQIQFKTEEHVTKSITASINKTAMLMAAPENRASQGAYRLHVLSTLLQAPVSLILEQVDSFGTDRFVQLFSSFLRRLSQNDSFQNGLSAALEQSMSLWGEKTVQDLLDESGMGEVWREDTQPLLTKIAGDFVQTAHFQNWFRTLMTEEP